MFAQRVAPRAEFAEPVREGLDQRIDCGDQILIRTEDAWRSLGAAGGDEQDEAAEQPAAMLSDGREIGIGLHRMPPRQCDRLEWIPSQVGESEGIRRDPSQRIKVQVVIARIGGGDPGEIVGIQARRQVSDPIRGHGIIGWHPWPRIHTDCCQESLPFTLANP